MSGLPHLRQRCDGQVDHGQLIGSVVRRRRTARSGRCIPAGSPSGSMKHGIGANSYPPLEVIRSAVCPPSPDAAASRSHPARSRRARPSSSCRHAACRTATTEARRSSSTSWVIRQSIALRRPARTVPADPATSSSLTRTGHPPAVMCRRPPGRTGHRLVEAVDDFGPTGDPPQQMRPRLASHPLPSPVMWTRALGSVDTRQTDIAVSPAARTAVRPGC